MNDQLHHDAAAAKMFAEKNFQQLIASLPKKLVEKEDNFLNLFKKIKVGPFKQLEVIYDFTGRLFSHVSPFIPCKENCAFCCYYRIEISEIEISYIEKRTRFRRNKTFELDKEDHGTPCPFLKRNMCSIYDVRPFSCRKHTTLTKDSYWCDPALSNQVKLPLLHFSKVEEAFMLLQGKSGLIKFYDIRQVFSGKMR
ncbi:MAG: YkgJ family cysteine cluster protein [Candidatus Electrothrix sp. AX2]|nr:YkgJ family cysteine cluster protein [Candidatus Electrothrix gigas]MCI5225653.1 YkgJ family cysteine cluster protein [Candidatus Electrothrix gigas]